MVPGLIIKNLPAFTFGVKVYLEIVLIVLYCGLRESSDQRKCSGFSQNVDLLLQVERVNEFVFTAVLGKYV